MEVVESGQRCENSFWGMGTAARALVVGGAGLYPPEISLEVSARNRVLKFLWPIDLV